MVRYACLLKMSLNGFGFSVSCWLDAVDGVDAIRLLHHKMDLSKIQHPNIVFREVAIVAQVAAEKGKDANHD